jgi:ketosteroid isomerase-like protein
MSPASQTPDIALLGRCFAAMLDGDMTVLEEALAADASWRTVFEGDTNCRGRGTIVREMRRGLSGRLRGSIEEMTQHGQRVLVGFRPERFGADEERPLDEGIAYMVVTLEEGRITELKGCATRADATHYASTGQLPSV